MSPEFSHRFPLDTVGSAARDVAVEATADECAAVARRFDLIALDGLSATARLTARAGGIDASGRLHARVVQACVVTGDPVTATIDQPFTLRFVDDATFAATETEVELDNADCDTVAHDGLAVDLGEAVAQTLGLALDPFPRSAAAGPDEQVWRAGPDAGPFAGLQTLLGTARS